MTDTPIAPALSAEQWEGEATIKRPEHVLTSTRHLVGSLIVHEWSDGDVGLEEDDNEDAMAIVPRVDRRAIAAFLLHGQPDWFTHEDVAFLRDPYAAMDYGDCITDEGWARYVRLADIIAALLPPEPAP